MTRPLITVIIPSYNRAEWLPRLLDSALAQRFENWNCVIVEDLSRQRAAIREIATRYAAAHPDRFAYYENAQNLGYDGNFREMVARASGRYVFVMGNDDLIAPDAFRAVARAVDMAPEMGLLLRSYARFRGDPSNVVQISRYYPRPLVFAPGTEAIVRCYRRIVAMSGLVIHRDEALACATTRWDGTLFYQHWLAVNVLRTRPAVFLPEVLALFRVDGTPEFGNAEAERRSYTPGVQPPDTDVRMIRNLLAIARDGAPECFDIIERDYANHMFPTFAHQAHISRAEFRDFYHTLAALGLGKYRTFHMWYWAVRLVGARNLDAAFQLVRKTLGHTPNLTRAAR